MTRKLHKLTDADLYKPSEGWHGFTVTDDKHRKANSFTDNAYLQFGALGSMNKTNGKPWLEVKTVETTFDKNGKARSHEAYVCLNADEMVALRDTINAILHTRSITLVDGQSYLTRDGCYVSEIMRLDRNRLWGHVVDRRSGTIETRVWELSGAVSGTANEHPHDLVRKLAEGEQS